MSLLRFFFARLPTLCVALREGNLSLYPFGVYLVYYSTNGQYPTSGKNQAEKSEKFRRAGKYQRRQRHHQRSFEKF